MEDLCGHIVGIQLADFGREIVRDVHDRFGRRNTDFVFKSASSSLSFS
jgi:hypothetical protein